MARVVDVVAGAVEVAAVATVVADMRIEIFCLGTIISALPHLLVFRLCHVISETFVEE